MAYRLQHLTGISCARASPAQDESLYLVKAREAMSLFTGVRFMLQILLLCCTRGNNLGFELYMLSIGDVALPFFLLNSGVGIGHSWGETCIREVPVARAALSVLIYKRGDGEATGAVPGPAALTSPLLLRGSRQGLARGLGGCIHMRETARQASEASSAGKCTQVPREEANREVRKRPVMLSAASAAECCWGRVWVSAPKDASSADIRKAYRKLSLILHPDKNKDENAEIQFRQLVAIYEVLKDEERRQRYDDILINGLPDWRQPVFYYRRVRKMSNAELALLLFIILTVGHYAVVWSIYLEKQLDELLSRKKREKKKKTGGRSVDETKSAAFDKNERVLDKPQWHDLLPCKLGIWFCLTVKALPQLIQDARQLYIEYKETKMKEKEDALAKAELETLQKEKKPKVKKPKSEFPVYTVLESNAYIPTYDHGASIEEIEEQMDDWLGSRNRTQKKKAPEWTEEDLSQLTRSMVKFPGGTPGRWEKIAHELGRSVADVTVKAKQAKAAVASAPGIIRLSELKSLAQNSRNVKVGPNLPDHIITQRERGEEEEEEEEQEGSDHRVPEQLGLQADHTESSETRQRKRKVIRGPEMVPAAAKEVPGEKGRGRRQKDFDSAEQDEESDEESRRRERSRTAEELWTQNQQKLLEMALQQHPKGTADRWDKIAKCVPGKSKEECIARYKLLVELVQKKKMAKN
ncbi:PREDICTED: dnaJ homolog subfamily C member 1 [Tinamus guttatus]|uniref:dnaJ homolog subfamily C member 1 n=1 Tax=Tinamus guttatus TaxID=94827 RepID=UPI00052F335B|nr:PREDICTED: dnaJ homolog subfamily C member 1 [Tinamus guttatus]